MSPHGESNDFGGTIYISSKDGTYVPFDRIEPVEYIVDPAYVAKEIDYSDFCASIEGIIRSRHISGMFDVLTGRPWTSAAQRWVRHNKRQKEKSRRKKLKEKGDFNE